MPESVKLFSLDRMARFTNNRNGDAFLIAPGEILALTKLDDSETWINYGQGNNALVQGSLQDVEDEINRALGATHAAHVQIATETRDKIQGLFKELEKSDDEEIFNMNDFVPKEVN